MSTAKVTLEAELREDEGKGASRRLRHHKKVPAVLYGGERKPRSITLNENELMNKARHESFFSQVLTIEVGDIKQSAIVKDVQVHPAKSRIMHVDFQRVSDDVVITMSVPLHFTNEEKAPGIALKGGVASHLKNEVEIACLPGDLPEYIEVDCSSLELDVMLHMSDIVLPEGVSIPELAQGEDYDQPILSISVPKKVVEPDPDEAAAADGDAAAGGEEESAD
ncbi:MAG: 50S ribosomal protein L25/general stress protein Ctc [Gammaproteobacteria bacterium]